MEIRPEMQIFPLRLVSEERAEKFISDIKSLQKVTKVDYKGFLSHDKKDFKVGWIWVEFENKNHTVEEKIEEICKQNLPFGYTIKKGRFTKYRATTADYIKGLNKEE
ncbi:MAG: methyl-coenzyme M reductase operon protein D [Candidatus Methanofastidiosia archaeon]